MAIRWGSPMLSGELGQIAILLLAALAVRRGDLRTYRPLHVRPQQIERRIRSLVCTRAAKAARKIQVEHTSHRRKAVADTLKDIEEREKPRRERRFACGFSAPASTSLRDSSGSRASPPAPCAACS